MKRMLAIILAVVVLGGCWEPSHPDPPSPVPDDPNPGPIPPGPIPPGPIPPGPNPVPPGPNPVPPEPSEKISVRISKVVDGDTFTARMSGVMMPVTIHLYGVDAPEVDQEFGDRSKAYFEDLISQFGDDVQLQIVDDKSRWSKIAWLELSNGLIYNYETVRTGWAWERDSGIPELVRLAAEAQEHGYGIWRSVITEEPWAWRQLQGLSLIHI